jgi:pimeloyl-ACP methyl ester carboxylesterase
VEPDKEVAPENRSVRLVTKEGATIPGRLLNQDSTSVQLINQKEELKTYLRANLREYTIVDKGLMPAVQGKLTDRQVADMVTYLSSLKEITPPGVVRNWCKGSSPGSAYGVATSQREFVLTAVPRRRAQRSTVRAHRARNEGIEDTEALRRYFVGKHGAPAETYVTGHSMGGHITMAIIERYPDVYQGAMPMCGPLGPAIEFLNTGVLDMLVTFETLFPGTIGSPYEPSRRRVASVPRLARGRGITRPAPARRYVRSAAHTSPRGPDPLRTPPSPCCPFRGPSIVDLVARHAVGARDGTKAVFRAHGLEMGT